MFNRNDNTCLARERFEKLKLSIIPPNSDLDISQICDLITEAVLPIHKRLLIIQNGPGDMNDVNASKYYNRRLLIIKNNNFVEFMEKKFQENDVQ